MKVLQLLPSIVSGDGISNEALQIDAILKETRFQTHIYAEQIGPGMDRQVVSYVDCMPELDREDVLLYHLSIGNDVYRRLSKLKCHLIFIYHNVTPSEYFRGYAPEAERNCRDGVWQIQKMMDLPELIMADSTYNAEHLKSLGYQCPMEIFPVLVDLKNYTREPDSHILEQYQDGLVNFLFVGRVVPNKKQEDLIRVFCAYHKWVNPQSRLILVGNNKRIELYHRELVEYCRVLGLSDRDVVFTGSVPFQELLAYYQVADMFLCMSEHEGFCIPLLEAMFFKLPIIAYDAAAVGETLGDAGLLLQTKDEHVWADAMKRLNQDKYLRACLARAQEKQIETFSFETWKKNLLKILHRQHEM